MTVSERINTLKLVGMISTKDLIKLLGEGIDCLHILYYIKLISTPSEGVRFGRQMFSDSKYITIHFRSILLNHES